MDWRFDLIEGFRVSASPVDGVEITRPALVTNIPVSAGTSDPEVLMKILGDTTFPGWFTLFPTTVSQFTGATLQDVQIRSRKQRNNSAIVDLIYRRKSGDGSADASSTWALEYMPNISHLKIGSTIGGEHNILVWHKSGVANSVDSPPSGSDKKFVEVTRMKSAAVLRATARIKGSEWTTLKPSIKALRDCINQDTWGTDPRGHWYFPGPQTRTTDFGRSYTITLDFIEAVDGHFPLALYFNVFGVHPDDCATEADVRAANKPDFGNYESRNGITLISAYDERPFSSVFAFTPDDA